MGLVMAFVQQHVQMVVKDNARVVKEAVKMGALVDVHESVQVHVAVVADKGVQVLANLIVAYCVLKVVAWIARISAIITVATTACLHVLVVVVVAVVVIAVVIVRELVVDVVA